MLNADTPFGVRRKAPMSNTERQRRFRARHPHYYRDLHRKRKARENATAQLMAEHPELTATQAFNIAIGRAPAPGSAPGSAPAPAPGSGEAPQKAEAPETPPVVLALPAPEDVVNPMVTMTLPDAFTYEPAKIRIVTRPPESRPQTLPDAGCH